MSIRPSAETPANAQTSTLLYGEYVPSPDLITSPDLIKGAGLGKELVATMIDRGPGGGFRWMLHTSDAHDLCRGFGFAEPDHRYMERPRGGGI